MIKIESEKILYPDAIHEVQKFYEINPEQKKNIKIKRIKFALSDIQRNEMLGFALKNNQKHYRMIKAQLECGMRISELLNLAIQQVNFNTNQISIESREKGNRYVAEFSTKTKSSNRLIPITDELGKILRNQIGKRKHGYVFLSNKNGVYSVPSAIRIVNQYARICKSIGRTIGSHALRRTYASFLLRQNVKIGKISKLLGHASIRTTMTYLYEIEDTANFDEIRDIVARMNKI